MSVVLSVAVSARALFDIEESARLFADSGRDAYIRHHRQRSGEPLGPGPAMPLVRALHRLNGPATEPVVSILICSSIDPITGQRILNSAEHHGLTAIRGVFSGGGPIAPYLEALDVDLLLSRSTTDTQRAVDAGIAAAVVADPPVAYDEDADGPLRLAFDGDAVLFGHASEVIFRQQGLEAFAAHEKALVDQPLDRGPFARVLEGLSLVRQQVGHEAIRIALITARSVPAHARALRTLEAWGLEVDEAAFCAGLPKTAMIKAFRPLMYFDDGIHHVEQGREAAPCALVPWRTKAETSAEGR